MLEQPDTILKDVNVFAHLIFKTYLGTIIILVLYLWKVKQKD